MTTDVLRLECDNLVIGSGLAGLVAALRLRGQTLVATAGLGATAISGGALSLPADRDADAERWFLETLRDTGCPYREGHCATDMLVERRGLVQLTMDLAGRPAVVALDGRRVAGALAVDVTPFAGRSCQEIAHAIEADDAALEALGSALAGAGRDSYLLPPVLGVTGALRARERLERATGARIYEYVTAPSVLGLRLLRALREVVDRNEAITVLETARIESIAGGGRGRLGTKGKREIAVRATNLVIATGGPLTGFRVEGDRLYEPLTGTAVADVGADLDDLFSSDHPLMFRGIGPRPGTVDGFREVRAAGAVAAGHGLYEALRTGYHAGDGL